MPALYYRDPGTGNWLVLPTLGAQGPTGPTGAGGVAGFDGPVGVVGIQGPTGPQGNTGGGGAVGPTGPTGARGGTGGIGPQGPQGLQGVIGVGGPQGIQGPGGNTGAPGANHPKQLRVGMASLTGGTNVALAVGYSAPFRVNVNVVTSMRTSVPGNVYVNCAANNIGLSQFDAVIHRTNTTTCLVDWLAVGDR